MNEETDTLITRLVPLIDEIELNRDLSPSLQGAIISASVSGGIISNLVIKLMILKQRGEIDFDQYKSLIMFQPEIMARLVKPDSRMTWMPLDEIELHHFTPVDNERFRAALAKIRGD